jgi:hypothetical protein
MAFVLHGTFTERHIASVNLRFVPHAPLSALRGACPELDSGMLGYHLTLHHSVKLLLTQTF